MPPSSHAGLFGTRGTATRTSACSRLQRAAAAPGDVVHSGEVVRSERPHRVHPQQPPRRPTSAMAWGTMPGASSVPIIVCVLPELVTPSGGPEESRQHGGREGQQHVAGVQRTAR